MGMNVVELFAGVGGFRIGLEGPPNESQNNFFKVIFSNQWEPSTKRQHAAEVYVKRWGLEQDKNNSDLYTCKTSNHKFLNKDIALVSDSEIPDHDLLVGGFPCQDYSVAKTLDKSKGIQGKKGVLWWEIYRILKSKRPKHILLENVDRLIKSPVSQRGRDFAIMLSCLSELDYCVEWRVINAADYGMPQKRRRLFILAHLKSTKQYSILSKLISKNKNHLFANSVLSKAFPVINSGNIKSDKFQLLQENEDIADLSLRFNVDSKKTHRSPFQNGGFMFQNTCITAKLIPNYEGKLATLSQILQSAKDVELNCILDLNGLVKPKGWLYLKGAKKELRTRSDGFQFNYSEGKMSFPDEVSKPSRTIITSEGGISPSRFKHVIIFKPTQSQIKDLNLYSNEHNQIRKKIGLQESEWLRRLTSIELERLNQFPDNHTYLEGLSEVKRAFFMGNALVVGIIRKIATELQS